MLLVGNGYVITNEDNLPYIASGCVAIDGNIIIEVGTTDSLSYKYPKAEFINANGNVIMPGFINSHMHLYSTFARGINLKEPPQNFIEILEKLWWRLDKVLTLEDIYYSALVVMIDCIKNGTTTIFDHHASAGAIRGSLFTLWQAAHAVGIRSAFCYEVSDRDGQELMLAGIKENVEFIKEIIRSKDELVRAMFGLHASMTLSDNTLEKCALANANVTGFHIHAAEAEADVMDSMAKSGKRVIERLADFAILGPKSIAAHCVHINEAEYELLKATRTKVVHNPESNMSNAVGCAPVLEMLKQDITVGLGTDGYTSDMFEAYKAANLLHKHQAANSSIAYSEAAEMLFKHNLRIADEYYARPIGRLVVGAYADVIVVDYDPPTPITKDNIMMHILFGMAGRAVATTIINGCVVMRDRKLSFLDEREINYKARELSAKLWLRF